MAIYEVTLEDGSVYEVETQDIQTTPEPKVGVFGKVPLSEYQAGERNIMGNIFERPGAALRSLIMGKGYQAGAINPTEVPTFQNLALDKYYQSDVMSKYPGLKTLLGNVVSAGGMAGDVATNPADLLVLIAGKTPTGGGTTLGGRMAGSKAGQAVSRFANMPIEETLPGRVVSKTAQAPIRFVQNVVKNIKNVKNPVRFSQGVRREFFAVKKQVGDAFEQGIRDLSRQYPDRAIDLSSPMQYIKSAMDDTQNNPGLASAVKSVLRGIKNPEKAKIIQGLIEKPETATNMTLAQVQEIKNAIQGAPSIATKLKQGKFADWKSGDLELLDLIDEIKLAQSEIFPEMAQVRAPYAQFMENYRVVKNMFKPGKLIEKMQKGFGDAEVEAMVKAILPKDVYGAIRGYKKTGFALKAGAGLAAAEELIRRGVRRMSQ